MSIKPTPELIEEILKRVPEGFIHRATLVNRLKTSNKNLTKQASTVGRERDYYFDSARVGRETVRDHSNWSRPAFPAMSDDGTLTDAPITERIAERAALLAIDPEAAELIEQLNRTSGYARAVDISGAPSTLQSLVDRNILRQREGFVYDPLRISPGTIDELRRRESLREPHERLLATLEAKPGKTAPEEELITVFGAELYRELLSWGDFTAYIVPLKVKPYRATWVRLSNANADDALKAANDATKIKDEDWQEALDESGDYVRPGAKEAGSLRSQVIARSYLLSAAAKRLGVHEETLLLAIEEGAIPSFTDPEEKVRLPADEVEAAYRDPQYSEQISAFEEVKTREVALVLGVSYSTLRNRLQKLEQNKRRPRWRDVRGKWGLPDTLREFRKLLREQMLERRTTGPERENGSTREPLDYATLRAQAESERERRRELRKRLLAAFPTWQHEGRLVQNIFLHVGPTNSGKTYHALQALIEAGSGWYLAPLRLLAFEIFDRLNAQGVPCNLLTGEEYIPIPGATFTAATVEMFNPNESGRCVIIDEAHMLADPDRGWAWTRAFMEAQSPEIRVISPPFGRSLIEQMSVSAGLRLTVVEHERLTPIRVAERYFNLRELPPKTILIAFSRQSVLQLKTELERMKRTVSVVYGNLPPEVRRKQAERFATGQTDICVATDAVGMGLNLPADYVVFYEVSKFDGKQNRSLTPSEVQQIGGRAGRYLYSEFGEIGATNKQDLKLIRQLYKIAPEPLTHAHVAPTVEDLEMIPGSLAERLMQWSNLQSIPEALRSAIKTADLTERIELAAMLTDQEVAQLGLAAAMRLINAPTRQNTRSYWYDCAQSILAHGTMPMPPMPPADIVNNYDLANAEASVACADIYLWLSRRPEFMRYAPDAPEVRILRAEWSQAIDGALLRRLDSARLCVSCGKPLPKGHRFRICDSCYADRRGNRDDFLDE